MTPETIILAYVEWAQPDAWIAELIREEIRYFHQTKEVKYWNRAYKLWKEEVCAN